MRVFTHTEPGGKAVNEDCVLARPHSENPDLWLCCVADGQGGQSNGEAAARRACDSFFENAAATNSFRLLEKDAMIELLERVDHAVSATGGFTTLIGAAINRDCVVGASAGDSKMYAWEPGRGITEVTARQRKNPPVGSGDAVFEPFVARVIGGLRLLMMTDGGWKYAGYENIERVLAAADFSNAALALREAVVSGGGSALPDDFSLIGIEID